MSKHKVSIEYCVGRFEVVVDGDLIYSKAETGRHAEAGEVNGLFVKKTGAEAAPLS